MVMEKILFVFWKIIGLYPYCFANTEKHSFSYVGAFYLTILICLYFISYIRAISGLSTNEKAYTIMMKLTEMAGNSCESWMVLTTWIVFGFRQNQLCKIGKSCVKIAKHWEILAIRDVNSGVMKKYEFQIILTNAIWVISFVVSHLKYPFNLDVLIWVPYDLGRIVLPNFLMIYIGVMIKIQQKFQAINEKLREIFELDMTGSTINEPLRRKTWDESLIESHFKSDPLAALGQVHMEMVNLTRSIIDLLSPSLYLAITYQLVIFSTIIYWIFVSVKRDIFWNLEFAGYSVALCFWLFFHALGMYFEIYISDAVSNEANMAGNVLHEVLSLRRTEKYVDSAKIWSLRMIQQPLIIKVLGDLQIKFSIAYKICSQALGYVTVMIQLDELDFHRNRTNASTSESKVN